MLIVRVVRVDFGVGCLRALIRAAMRALRDRQKLKEVRGYGDRRVNLIERRY